MVFFMYCQLSFRIGFTLGRGGHRGRFQPRSPTFLHFAGPRCSQYPRSRTSPSRISWATSLCNSSSDFWSVPTEVTLARFPISITSLLSLKKSATGVTYKIDSTLPDTSEWFKVLSGPELSWLRALLTSQTIVQGRSYIDNTFRQALCLRAGLRVIVGMSGKSPVSLTIYSTARSFDSHNADFKVVEIKYSASLKLRSTKAAVVPPFPCTSNLSMSPPWA